MVSLDEYASYFDNIDPLAPYKKWMTGQQVHKETTRSRANVVSERVQAAFIVSDPVDWSRDIQVIIIFPFALQFQCYILTNLIDALLFFLRSFVTFYELEDFLGKKVDLNLFCTLLTTI